MSAVTELFVVVGPRPLEGRQIGSSGRSADSQQTEAFGHRVAGHFCISSAVGSMTQRRKRISSIYWIQITSKKQKTLLKYNGRSKCCLLIQNNNLEYFVINFLKEVNFLSYSNTSSSQHMVLFAGCQRSGKLVIGGYIKPS